jgi:hypothetical protein
MSARPYEYASPSVRRPARLNSAGRFSLTARPFMAEGTAGRPEEDKVCGLLTASWSIVERQAPELLGSTQTIVEDIGRSSVPPQWSEARAKLF